jgi:hypothetical protein
VREFGKAGSSEASRIEDVSPSSVTSPEGLDWNFSCSRPLLAVATGEVPMTEIDSPAVRAPDFPATLDWIHTGGRRLTLADFRGKLLFLDFWTYG